MPLWSGKILEIISLLLNLLRLVLCPSMWSVLENVPCALEKNVYSISFGCNIMKISIKSNCSIVLFRISVALLIFCLEDLSTDVSGVLKPPTTIAFSSVSPFTSVSICFMYLSDPILCAYMLTHVISSSYIDPSIII